jgi:hypothetical protein
MIKALITRAEALLIIELINKSATDLINTLLIAVEEESEKEQVANAAKQNYVVNLENEVKTLKALLDAKNLMPATEQPKTEPPKKMVMVRRKARWGLKKDGTPKAKPGRKTAKRTTKGTK